MNGNEDLAAERVRKFVSNAKKKHGILSASFLNSTQKIEEYLMTYLVDDVIINRVYELVFWAEAHDNVQEIDEEFKELLRTFWE